MSDRPPELSDAEADAILVAPDGGIRLSPRAIVRAAYAAGRAAGLADAAKVCEDRAGDSIPRNIVEREADACADAIRALDEPEGK